MLIDKTEEQQVLHAKMLSDAQDILLSFGVIPVLSGSALLGGYRNGDLLPWQTGVVLIVKYEEIKHHVKNIINAFILKGFSIHKFFKHRKEFKITVKKENLVIEITGYHFNKDNNRYERKCKSKYKSVPDYFFKPPYEKLEIRGVKYNVPLNYTGYLKLLYGEDWETPKRSSIGGKFRNQELYRY